MVEIGGKPILWHILKIYSKHGVNDFIICLGYKGYDIKEYFANYFLHMSDVAFDIRSNKMEVHQQHGEPCRVTRVRQYLGNETFCFTYGEGVPDVRIDKLITHHNESGKKVTVTAIQPPG